MELSIVLVNYNTKDLLRNCLNSIIENSQGLDYEIIVVDNISTDGSVEMLESKFPDIQIIKNNENVGYSKATNQGVDIAKGDNILYLNTDTVIIGDCLEKVAQFVKSREDVNVVGCKMLNPDGSLQYTCRHAPNILTELVYFTKGIIKNFPDPITYWKKMKYWKYDQIREVNSISGAFLWVKKEVVDTIGGWDEKIFLYYEDSEFCRRIRKAKYKIIFFPYAEIIHFGRASSGDDDKKKLRICYEGCLYYLNKIYGHRTKQLFAFLCNVIWRLELIIFSMFKWNDKCNKKVHLLRSCITWNNNL